MSLRPGRLEEAHGALERRRIGPSPSLKSVRSRCASAGWAILAYAGGSSHSPVREAGQVLGRPAERGEGGSVRARTGARRPRPSGRRAPEPGPTARRSGPRSRTRAREPALPGGELALDALDGVPALEVAVGELELELLAIGPVERRQVPAGFVRVDELGLEPEIADRSVSPKPLKRARARGRSGSRRKARGAGRASSAPRWRQADGAVAAREELEEVVEGADRPPEQRRTAREQVPLDAVDLRPVGDDEERLALEVLEISIEEPRDLPRIRANQQREHRPILPAALEAPCPRSGVGRRS